MAAKRTVIGLDVGKACVRAVWVERRKDALAVVRAEQLRLPPGGGDMSSVIVPWIEQQRLAQHPCVLGVPGHLCMFQPFTLPPGDPRTLEDAAAMETVKFNEMASETMTCGFTPITLNAGERRLLLAMARPSALENFMSLGRQAGLEICDVVPTPVALFKALCAPPAGPAASTPEGAVMYLGVGHSSTDVAIGSPATGLMFARAFSSGGQTFTERLARERKLPVVQAETSKTRDGGLHPDNALLAPLKQAADMWLSEVQACMNVYRNLLTGRQAEIVRVVLAGGGASMPGFAEYVQLKLERPVVAAEGLAHLPGLSDPLSFAVAAGLGVCGMEGHGGHVSLLPADVRDELIFRRQKPYWIAAGLVAALILGVSLVGGVRDYRRQASELTKQRASLKRRQDLVSEIEQIRHRNGKLAEMAAPLAQLLRAGPVMRDLIQLVGEKKSPNDVITLVCDADSYFHAEDWVADGAGRVGTRDRRRIEERKQQRAATLGIQRVIIEGYTRFSSYSTVKQLIEELRKAPFVASADLLSDDKRVDAAGGEGAEYRRGRTFAIDVAVKTP